jgi:hypothetical protein
MNTQNYLRLIVYGLILFLCLNFNNLFSTKESGAASEPANTITGNVFADNDFELYVNGKLVAEDEIDFTPHNVVKVSFKAEYPMVIAVKAVDFNIEGTGLEYDNTKAGDGGLILRFTNGIATNGNWKAKKVEWGPTNLEECLADPSKCIVRSEAIPPNWYGIDFDDSNWGKASIFTRAQVNPRARDYDSYDWKNAEFIWTEDLLIDNVILFRYRVEGPAE